MNKELVNIDIKAMAPAFSKHVRTKARIANSRLTYMRNGIILSEDPNTGQIIILADTNKK